MILSWTAFTVIFGFFSFNVSVRGAEEMGGGWSTVVEECPRLPNSPSPTPPKDVYDVGPRDIKVVMALGDSITAAFGAKIFSLWLGPSQGHHAFTGGFSMNFLINTGGIFDEYRGLSYSIGQDKGAVTLPNFLKHYSPHLVGGSIGQHPLTLCWGSTFCSAKDYTYRPMLDGLNAAISGAESINLDQEFDYILGQLKKNPEIDIEGDWKVLTLCIGGNDICRNACHGKLDDFVEHYLSNVRNALNRVKAELPKTIVNVLLVPDVSQVEEFNSRHSRCLHARPLMIGFCPCAVLPEAYGKKAMKEASTRLNAGLLAIIRELNEVYRREAQESGKAQDFGLITIPLLSQLDLLADDFPEEFAAKLDCFHPSALCHANAAKELWRSMFVPLSERKSKVAIFSDIYCPTEKDRFIIE